MVAAKPLCKEEDDWSAVSVIQPINGMKASQHDKEAAFLSLLDKLGVPAEMHDQILTRNRKNTKLLNNLAMIDGMALCFNSNDAEIQPRTFLDKMNVNELTNTQGFDKPTHIDRLFANEEAFLDD